MSVVGVAAGRLIRKVVTQHMQTGMKAGMGDAYSQTIGMDFREERV
jgi:hypothetical protein